MSLNNVNQRTEITVLKPSSRSLKRTSTTPPKSLVALSHGEQTADHRDDASQVLSFQQTTKESQAMEHGVATIPVAVLASLKRQLDSAQTSIADLERYAAQVGSKHRVDLEH